MDTIGQIGEEGKKKRDWHQEMQMANLSDLDKLLLAQAVKLIIFERADDAQNFIREFNQQNGDAIPFQEFVEGGGLLSAETINQVRREYGKLAVPKNEKVDLAKPESVANFKKSLSLHIDFNLMESFRSTFEEVKEISMPGQAPAADPNGTVATSDAQIPAKPPSKKGRERYELIKQIGKGGMGVVYLFHDKHTDRPVVMKTIIPESWCSDLEARENMYNTLQLPYFKRESKITMALVGDSKDLKIPDNEGRLAVKVNKEISQGHKYIVPMRDYVDQEIEVGGQILGKDWLKLELVKGETLDKLVLGNKAKKIKDFSRESEQLRDRLDWYMKICAGIAYAHEKGIINRDIKPANMLLDTSENNPAIKKGEATVRIIDWGLAKHYDEKKDKELGEGNKAKTDEQILKEAMEKQQQGIEVVVSMQGDIKGTLTHMAPEQAAGKADKLADVYALGVILHEMMTGKHYRRFISEKDKSSEQLISDIVCRNVNYDLPSEAAKTMNPELESIILKSTEHRKEQRYQSVAELMRDVKAYLTYNEVEAYKGRYTQEQRDALYRKRNAKEIAAARKRNAIIGLSAAGVLAIVGTVWGYMHAQKSQSDYKADKAIEGKEKAEERAGKTAEQLAAEAKARREADEKAAKEKKDREEAERVAKKAEEDRIAAEKKAAEEKIAREKEESIRKENRTKAENIVKDARAEIGSKGRGGLEKAIEMFTEAHKIDKTYSEPLYERGMANYLNELPFQAITDFVNADKTSKETTGNRHIQSLFYAGLANIVYFERFKESGGLVYRTDDGMVIPDAEFFFNEIEKIPGDKDLGYRMLVKSMRLFSQDKFEEAYQLAEKTKNENPANWVAHWYLGVLKSKRTIPTLFTSPALGKYQTGMEALKELIEAADLEKNCIRSKVDLVDAYLSLALTERGDDRALVLVRQLITDEVKRYGECRRPSLFLYEAIGFQQRGDFAESNKSLENSLKYDKPEVTNNMPHKPHILAVRGKNKHMLKDFAGAEKDYTAAIALSEQIEKTQKDAGYLQRLTGVKARSYSYRGILKTNLESALTDCSKAVELMPEWNDAYLNRGAVYEKIGKQDKAIEDYQQAIKLGEQEALLALGNLYAKSGKKKEAREAIKQYMNSPNSKQKEEAQKIWDKITASK